MQRIYKINYYQVGGKNYYLPCEITHYTSKKYYNNTDFIPGVEDIKRTIGPADNSVLSGKGYYQDGYIQLFDGLNYINLFNTSIIGLNEIEKEKSICVTPTCTIINRFSKNLIKEVLQGDECNLVYSHTVSAGECKKFKVRSPELTDEFATDEFIPIKPIEDKHIEQNKGGNFISAPDKTIFYIEGASDELIDKIREKVSDNIVELKCSFKSGKGFTFRHIDEIMCFMPYGSDGFKIWFYDEFDRTCFNQLLKLQYNATNDNLDQIIEKLNQERLENLEIICRALFQKSYSACTDKFVFFKFYSFLPSVLNRVWYETKTQCICLFPNIEPMATVSLSTVQSIKGKVIEEMAKVKSLINPDIRVDYHFIDVRGPNEMIPEGTVHCLIKQRFINSY